MVFRLLTFYIFTIFILATSGFALDENCLSAQINIKSADWRDIHHRPKRGMLEKHSIKHNKITIHYMGTPAKPELGIVTKLRGLYKFSFKAINNIKTKLWGDMPYNFYIDYSGIIAEGRKVSYKPDTNTNYDTNGHITVVIEGNEADGLKADQKDSLFKLIKCLQYKYQIPITGVGVHKDYSRTQCPGAAIQAAIDEYKQLNVNLNVF